jgi:hypothetical protein
VDKVSIVKLHEETKPLTFKFNQLAIESIKKLVLTIMNNESKGLKDFFEANVPQEKCLRSTILGKLNPIVLGNRPSESIPTRQTFRKLMSN